MCSLVGIYKKDGGVQRAEKSALKRMMTTLQHRGPDSEGTWFGDSLALGHQRLAIMDLSALGHQPMVSSNGQGVLALNGEVYNFHELREALEKEGVVCRSQTDTEVLLEALHLWGVSKTVPRLNGMFAFAYFDQRSQTLWLARDRLGIKPLSVLNQPDRILFASEDKALLVASTAPKRVADMKLTAAMLGQTDDSSISLFDGIERLPPGSIWKIHGKTIEKSTYWSALDALDVDRLMDRSASFSIMQDRLETVLRESVRLHCISDARLATACSGGVDSSLLTAFTHHLRPGFRSYVVDPQMGESEADSALRVGRHTGVEVVPVELARENYLRLLPKTVWHLEALPRMPMLPGLLAMSERCAEDGNKVLITGEGADEQFGGYPWHMSSAKLWRSMDWPRNLFHSKKRRVERLKTLAKAPFSYGFHSRAHPFFTLEKVALKQRILDKLAPLPSHADRAFVGAGIYDMHHHMQNLLHQNDRMSMASSVELRVPFVENGVIDFALHQPPRMRRHRQHGKWLLKQVAARHIPRENVFATKKGFPISHSFHQGAEKLIPDGPLREAMEWTDAQTALRMERAGADPGFRFRVICADIFLRLFTENETPSAIGDRLL